MGNYSLPFYCTYTHYIESIEQDLIRKFEGKTEEKERKPKEVDKNKTQARNTDLYYNKRSNSTERNED